MKEKQSKREKNMFSSIAKFINHCEAKPASPLLPLGFLTRLHLSFFTIYTTIITLAKSKPNINVPVKMIQ